MRNLAIENFRCSELERWINDAINLLDAMDGDADLEAPPLPLVYRRDAEPSPRFAVSARPPSWHPQMSWTGAGRDEDAQMADGTWVRWQAENSASWMPRVVSRGIPYTNDGIFVIWLGSTGRVPRLDTRMPLLSSEILYPRASRKLSPLPETQERNADQKGRYPTRVAVCHLPKQYSLPWKAGRQAHRYKM